MAKLRESIKSKFNNQYPVCEICGKEIRDIETVYYNDQYCCKDCEEYFWMGIREDFLIKVEE